MSLGNFLEQCRASGELKDVRERVSLELELARRCRQEFALADNAVLRFSAVIGNDYQVAGNLFGSERRLLRILAADSFASFSQRIESLMQAQQGTGAQRLRAAASRSRPSEGRIRHHHSLKSLRLLPAIISWPRETKPYLTLPLIFVENPVTGEVTLGLYRAQVINEEDLAVNIAPGGRGAAALAAGFRSKRKVRVAIVLGAEPAWYWLASAPLPRQCSQAGLFSSLFGSPQLARGELTGIAVPAASEFLLEGDIDPTVQCVEGPFANHTGSYVRREDCPVMRVQRISCSDEPVMPVTVVGPPPSENIHLARGHLCLIRELLRLDLPELVDIAMPALTAYHGVAIISLRNRYGRDNADIIHQLRSDDSPLKRSRLLLLVDEDVRVQMLEQCLWRAVNRLAEGRCSQHPYGITIDATGVDPDWLITEA